MVNKNIYTKTFILIILMIIMTMSVSAFSVVDQGTSADVHEIFLNDNPEYTSVEITIDTGSSPGGWIVWNYSAYDPLLDIRFDSITNWAEGNNVVWASKLLHSVDLPLGTHSTSNHLHNDSYSVGGWMGWFNVYNVSGTVYHTQNPAPGIMVDMPMLSSSFEVDGVNVVVTEDMMNPLQSWIQGPADNWMPDDTYKLGLLHPLEVSYFKIDGEDYVFDEYNGDVYVHDGTQWVLATDYNTGLPTNCISSFVILGDKLVALISMGAFNEGRAYYLDEATHSWIRDDSYMSGFDLGVEYINSRMITFVDDGVPRMMYSGFRPNGKIFSVSLYWNGSMWLGDYNQKYLPISQPDDGMYDRFQAFYHNGLINIIDLIANIPESVVYEGGVASSNDYSFPFVNSEPVITNLEVTPSPLTPNQNAVCSWDYYDPDMDPQGASTITWSVNSVIVDVVTYSGTNPVLLNNNYSVNDVVTCEVLGNDGSVNSTNTVSTSVTVVDAVSSGGGSSGFSVSSSSSDSRSDVVVPDTSVPSKKVFFLVLVGVIVFYYYKGGSKKVVKRGKRR